MPNKGMKLTSAELIGRSQLIPGVGRTESGGDVNDLEIVWAGTSVGRVTNVDYETVRLGFAVKVEGDFIPASGSTAAEFQVRLVSHDALPVKVRGWAGEAPCTGAPGAG